MYIHPTTAFHEDNPFRETFRELQVMMAAKLLDARATTNCRGEEQWTSFIELFWTAMLAHKGEMLGTISTFYLSMLQVIYDFECGISEEWFDINTSRQCLSLFRDAFEDDSRWPADFSGPDHLANLTRRFEEKKDHVQQQSSGLEAFAALAHDADGVLINIDDLPTDEASLRAALEELFGISDQVKDSDHGLGFGSQGGDA